MALYEGESLALDVKVIIEDQRQKNIEELVEAVDLSDCVDENGNIILKRLILLLKNDYNFPLENKEIYFFLELGGLFMNCGIDPVNEDIKIRSEDYRSLSSIIIKGKDLGISMVHRLMSFENHNAKNDEKQKISAQQSGEKSTCRRTKERRIGHIIDKVIEWRKYYSGTTNSQNQKFSLEEAAKNVNISKKSLDDYLFQMRFGHRYGFNFNEHYNDKVGVLRDFVRQNKKKDKTQIKTRKANNKEAERQRD